MTIRIIDNNEDRVMTLDQLGEAFGARAPARSIIHATYVTDTFSPTVFYSALLTDGSVLTDRTSSGITLANNVYSYPQPIIDQDGNEVTDFLALWDEGDPDDYVTEWIVVDT